MLRICGSGAAAAILMVALAPNALGQQQTAPSPTVPGTERTTAGPVETGRLQRSHGAWRSSEIVGAAVYNDHDERIGSVGDLLVGQDGKISEVVLSVGGFLGIGAKLVAVPYSQLRFEEHADNRTTTGGPAGTVTVPPVAPVGTPAAPATPATPTAAPPARPVATTRLVLPGATRDSLRAQPEFRYRD